MDATTSNLSKRYPNLLDAIAAGQNGLGFSLGPSAGDDGILGPSVGDDVITAPTTLGPSVGDDIVGVPTMLLGPCLGDDNAQVP